jgi:hypothetical protein
VLLEELNDYPMGKIDRQISDYLINRKTEARNDPD